MEPQPRCAAQAAVGSGGRARSLSLARRALESLHTRMCAYVQIVPLGGLTTQVMQ